MYQNIYFDKFNEVVHLWDDIEGYFKYKYEPYAFIADKNGDHQTLHGDKVRKITSWDDTIIRSGNLYEHDIRPEVRTLVDIYGNSDEVSTNHCVMFIDIEVAKDVKYSTAQEATNPIISICAYDDKSEITRLFILEKSQYTKFDINREDVQIFRYHTERELLDGFIEYYKSSGLTIITGWDIIRYDLPYLYNRSERLFGKWSGGWLSPINKVRCYQTKRGGDVFIIAGVAVLDYLKLYKTLVPTELPSYNLNAVSMHELGHGKIKYEGTLQQLYEQNIAKFIDYNIEDVKLVMELDAKLDFIAIAMGVCHKGHVPYDDIYFTSRYMDGACITEIKRRGLVVSSAHRGDQYDGMAEGALVKTTKPGRYSWVYDLDLRALYPSNIITLNISPETKWGKILNWNSNKFVSDTVKTYDVQIISGNEFKNCSIPSGDIKKLLKDNNICVAGNGMLYDKRQRGLIPGILVLWADERVEFRKKSDKYHADGDLVKSAYYDRKQKIQKVLLNSLYGVLLLQTFRFYDKDNGEAVTITGQQVITYTQTMGNHFYNVTCGTNGIDYCTYSDTDSVFYEALPILNSRKVEYTDDTIADLCIGVATEMQNFINSAYDIYAKEFHLVDTHVWEIKQELIARRAFWGDVKKRYAMWLVRDGKKTINKFDIKGFDSVRSNFPSIFRTFLEKLIHGILEDKTRDELTDTMIKLKDELSNSVVYDIMNPTSVNGLDKYKPTDNNLFKTGTPVHVKAALNHNKLLDKIGSTNYAQIQSGDKILWVYLVKNPYMMDTMALKGYDDDPEIVKYVEQYIYRDKLFDKALLSKVQSLWDSLGWGTLSLNKNINKVFDVIS